MHIALLGRQPELSIAELERVFERVAWFTPETALVDCDNLNIERLGGTQKAGRVIDEFQTTDWHRVSQQIINQYSKQLAAKTGKITLGISAYGFDVSTREVQKVGLVLKGKLKNSGPSLRLIPNQTIALSTATSHHNKLGLAANKIELLIVKGVSSTIVAESVGAQNITALAQRDQGRPKRDAFVGMLPPKLAQMIVNFAVGNNQQLTVLDPFCGTGVLLQEAALLGYSVYGTDISEKMIRYSRDNLNWLETSILGHKIDWYLHEGDAVTTKWRAPILAVASETYLGQPFSAPPSESKLKEVRGNCNHIIGGFLANLSKQLQPGTTVALAVPAWRNKEGIFSHLPLTSKLQEFGFQRVPLKTVETDHLLYARDNQVVAREILILVKA